jgi:hypothetical protein
MKMIEMISMINNDYNLYLEGIRLKYWMGKW